nr:hypothetical protein CFP56_26009 [Quercus suber]
MGRNIFVPSPSPKEYGIRDNDDDDVSSMDDTFACCRGYPARESRFWLEVIRDSMRLRHEMKLKPVTMRSTTCSMIGTGENKKRTSRLHRKGF